MVRFCFAWRKWLLWDGQRWKIDDRGRPYQLAKNTIRRMQREAASEPDDSKRRELSRWAFRSDSRQGYEALLALARSEPGIPITPEELDRNLWLLNCANGTINLRTGKLQPHRREDLISKLAPGEYHPGATAARWLLFLEQVLPDPALRRFVQAAVGYSLTGDVSEQVLFFLYGHGANGKSVFMSTIQAVLGDYAVQVIPDMLMTRKGEHHPTELTDLQGRRFVATIEAEEGRRFNEALVKSLTGGDKIRARRMHEDFWQFDPTHKVWVAANCLPVIRGADHAIWRRFRLIPFKVTIPEGQRDPHLSEALKAEGEGILRWAVDGCLAWLRDGLRAPAAVIAATTNYKTEMDLVGRFITDCCICNPSERVAASDLYRSFEDWCASGGEAAFSQQMFGRRLTDSGFTREKRRNGHWWKGLGLRGGNPTHDSATDVTDAYQPCDSPPIGVSSREDPKGGCKSVTRGTPKRQREPGDDDEPLPGDDQ